MLEELITKGGPILIEGVKALVALLEHHDDNTKRVVMDAAMAAAEEELARRMHNRKPL